MNNLNNVVVETTKSEQPKWNWVKINVNKNVVRVHYNKDDNNSILVGITKDLDVWFDCKNVIASPYTNYITINLADGRKYKTADKSTILGSQIIDVLKQ